MPTDLATIKMHKWHKGRVVLLGDAAHAMEPYAGLGASMAMEDAYVLAGELVKIGQGYSLESVLNNYEKLRRKRVNEASFETRILRRGLLSKSWIRNKIIEVFAPIIPIKYFTKNFHKLLAEKI